MDDDNANIFAGGDVLNQSKPDGNSAGLPGTGASVEGRIDPAIAIAANGSGGTGGGSNPGGGTVRAPGKRGRHPNGCSCEKCAAKGQAPGGVAAAPIATPKAEKTRPIKAGLIEKTLLGIHLGLVAVTKCPEFLLEKDDAEKLGDSVAAVMAFHKVKITPEQEAYGDLLIVAAQVYPPMVMSVWLRKTAEAEKKRNAAPGIGHNGGPPMPAQRANVPPPPLNPQNNVSPLRPVGAGPAFDPFKIDLPSG